MRLYRFVFTGEFIKKLKVIRFFILLFIRQRRWIFLVEDSSLE